MKRFWEATMPKLLIKLTGQQNQIYLLDETSIKIGRGDEADLILPNVSVSREHALVEVTDQGVFLTDLGSQNGLTIDGEEVPANERQLLKSKSEIQIGNFSLIYLSDTQEDRFYRGRSVTYLPKYDPRKNLSLIHI